jgi:hypothetical protein
LFRGVLTALLCLPMLLPQGVCLCRWEAMLRICPPRPAALPAQKTDARTSKTRSRCPCCHKTSHPPADLPETSAWAPARPVEDWPADERHAPGCPAGADRAPARAESQEGPAFAPTFPGQGIASALPLPDAPRVSVRRGAPELVPVSLPPVYLLCCDFRC